MSDFKAKMHQNPKFDWGSAPDPAGELTALPRPPIAGFKGPTSNGRERERNGGREGEAREGSVMESKKSLK